MFFRKCFPPAALSAFLIAVAGIFASPAPVHAATFGVPADFLTLNRGLIGWWTMDGKDTSWSSGTAGTVRDASGNGNTGTLTNMDRALNPALGVTGQGMSFDNTDDYIDIGDKSFLDGATAATACTWLKYTAPSVADDGDLIAEYSSGTNDPWLFWVDDFAVFSGRTDTVSFGPSTSAGPGGRVEGSTGLVTPGKWDHYCGVFIGGTSISLYKNGVLDTQNTTSIAASIPSSSDSVRIGSTADGGTSIPGILDDVRVYNRALSVAEIRQLYSLGQAKQGVAADPLRSGLVGWWTLDGKDLIPNVRDRSGQANHANLLGFTSTTTELGKLGQGLRFSNSGNYALVPDAPSLHSDDGTVSMWLRTTVDDDSIVFESAPSIEVPGFFDIEIGTNSTGNLTDDVLTVYVTDASNVQYSVSFVSSDRSVLFDNKWHLLTVTVDTTTHIYLDGVSKTVTPAAGTDIGFFTSAAAQTIFTFGAGIFNGVQALPLIGSLDDVRIYNRALSAAEVRQLYSLGQARQGVTPSSALTSGLAGWWTFDGPDMFQNVRDKSGQGHNGYLLGQTSTSTVLGKLGQALSFDGLDDHVDMGDINAIDGTAALTVSAWVKTSGVGGASGERHFLDKSLCTAAPGSGTFELIGYQDKATFSIYPNGGSYSLVQGTTNIDDTKWHHVTGVYNGADMIIYVDGAAQNTNSVGSFNLSSNSASVELGGDCNGTGPSNDYNWPGQIDDARIYTRALTAAEIRQLYNQGR